MKTRMMSVSNSSQEEKMNGPIKGDRPVMAGLALALIMLVPAGLNAQSFVYTNNDAPGPTSVSAFSIGAGGTLSPVAGSPFATGGAGLGLGLFASNRITASVSGNLLYVSNCGTNNVSGFSINASTGVLTTIPGSPFATGGSCGSGIAVTTTPNNQFLYAANAGSKNISAFGIAANGALSPVAGSPFAAGYSLDGIKVSPDGKYLAVAIVNSLAAQVAMFSIGLTGALTAVPGSPFPVGGTGGAAGVDFNCASNLLFVGEGGPATTVSVQSVASNGALSPIAGSPFTFGGLNSNVIVLSPDDLHAFVSNQGSLGSSTITALDVASGGSLTQVAGSPFANPGGLFPSGMATNQAGTYLYAANFNNKVTGFSIAGNGALAPVPGSPFATGVAGQQGLLSLAVFPPKSCVVSVPVPLDIKPGSCPNPLNTNERGVIPVAIAGTAGLDVTRIDPASVELAGVPALRSSFEDVATPSTPFTGKTNCDTDCTTAGPDGIPDMILHFDAEQVVAALGSVTDGECIVVPLTGRLLPAFGGTAIKGGDVVIIRKKK